MCVCVQSVQLDYFNVHVGIYDNITSRYPEDFDITPSFSYIISGVRNLNNGPCFVRSVNNRSVVCQIREL